MCTGVEVQQAGWVRDQSSAWSGARAAVIWALDIGNDNEKKPWPDLVGGACRARAFASGCNIVVGLVWSLSHAKPLAFFEGANEVCCFCQLGRGRDKDSELRGQASVGKRELIGDVNNVASYAVPHDSANVLRRRSLGLSIIERVRLICKETKGHACGYRRTMGEGINPALYARVVIECVAVKVAKL